jgi:nucleoid-associated protein YgaU
MADQQELQQKYQPVLDEMQKFAEYGAKVDTVDMQGDKLHIKGEVPSTVIANRIWDIIKRVDPTYSDLAHEIATTGGDTQPYTIKSGDTLSAISLLFYGNANKYPEIASANGISNPNSVPLGTVLQLPVLS